MKIKNMKLMLLGLLTVMGVSNAFAAVDEESRSVNDVLYKLETTGTNKTATVVGVNTLASTANQETISIPATVDGEHGTYKVIGFNTGWASKVLNVTAKTLNLSIDVTNFATFSESDAFNAFTKLQTLTITDNNASSAIKKIDCSATGFKTTLKSYDFSGSKIEELAANCFKGYTAFESINLTGIKTIGANAFDGCNNAKLKSLEIPATVTSIGASAFDNMLNLENLTINSGLTTKTIPAAFAGASNLLNVTISGNATTIASGAIVSTKIKNIDLTGAADLATITGAFATSTQLETVKMAGTKILDPTTINLSSSKSTLTTWTCADGITTAPASFAGFTKLTEVDLSKANVSLNTANFNGDSQLATVKVNPDKYTAIGASAFEGCTKLATIEGVFNKNITTIGADAFKKAGLATLDMSALNPGKISTIPAAFSEMAKLTEVILPKKQGGNAITAIAQYAFAKDAKLAKINLEDTEITTLPILFQSALTTDETSLDDLTALTLPETLTTINQGALQFLGLEAITIPSSVTLMFDRVLQGCVNLKTFTWEDAQQNSLGINTFLGDTNLESVTFLTQNAIPGTAALSDDHFKMCDKNTLMVYVSAESYEILVAAGWTPANAKYSTLAKGDGDATITFGAAAADGYYYKSYYNDKNATWFAVDKFDVYSAVVEGNKVVLKPATAVEGYYKVQQLNVGRTNKAKALCIIRTKDKDNKAELKSVPLNKQQSTLPTDNQLDIADANNETTMVKKGSKVNYMYQLGKLKDSGNVAFYRVTSGVFKNNSIFIDASVSFANLGDVLEIVIEGEGEATGINAFQQESENNGAIYNLQGVQVQGAKKGLYIQNGKKFIVK